MTAPSPPSANVAGDNARVGVQAQVVHGDVIYQLPPDAPAEEKFRVGVNYLIGRMVPRSLTLIEEAVANGYDTWELRFYWVVALLSGRTLRQFSEEDIARLDAARLGRPSEPENDWAEGLRIISRLVDLMISPGSTADVEVIVKEFDSLAVKPRDMILQHLEVFLSGALDDQMWERELRGARGEQQANNRKDRAWIFFEPPPADPRVRGPAPSRTSAAEEQATVVSTVALVAAGCCIGWDLLWHMDFWGLVAWVVAVASGRACLVTGVELGFLARRRRAFDDRYLPSPERRAAIQSDEFASGVDDLFERYFKTWVPRGMDYLDWLAATSGIRSFLRDEIVEVYGDRDDIVEAHSKEKVKAEQVAWLVRHRHKEVRKLVRDGTLWDYRDQLHSLTITKLAFVGGLGILVLSVLGAGAALSTEPLTSVVLMVIAIAAGGVAARGWVRILVEFRRKAAEREESERRLADTTRAFERWQERLLNKPADPEMATWLDCDRKMLLDFAMQHYQVSRSRLIAHAFIELPGESYSRARVLGGPWRYSDYRLLVFLLTDDGVHQVEADLDFKEGSYHERERISFGYDAITAVTATVDKRTQRTFHLGLGNGQSIEVVVTDPSANLIQEGEDEDQVSDAQWDATSLANTLRVLEGVAGAGREWIKSRDRLLSAGRETPQ
jgi:hypothetical protein